MKKIRICHLYGNLLNTYGDIGNIMAIEYELSKMSMDYERRIVSLDEEFVADDFDFVFFGGGQDYEQMIVRDDLIKKKDQLIKYIEKGGALLAVCGGYQLLGKYYYNAKNEKIDGLNIFNHYTVNQTGKHRFTGNIKIETKDGEIYCGFENHGGVTYLSDDQVAFATVLEGNGNNGVDKTEGFIYKNTIGTYLHGPLLARNKKLCKRIVEKII